MVLNCKFFQPYDQYHVQVQAYVCSRSKVMHRIWVGHEVSWFNYWTHFIDPNCCEKNPSCPVILIGIWPHVMQNQIDWHLVYCFICFQKTQSINAYTHLLCVMFWCFTPRKVSTLPSQCCFLIFPNKQSLNSVTHKNIAVTVDSTAGIAPDNSSI